MGRNSRVLLRDVSERTSGIDTENSNLNTYYTSYTTISI